MRERVQYPSGEKQDRQIALRYPVPAKEPVGNQRRAQESSADAVNPEEQRQLRDR